MLLLYWSCTSKAVSFNPHLNCSIMMQNALLIPSHVFSSVISMFPLENHEAYQTS